MPEIAAKHSQRAGAKERRRRAEALRRHRADARVKSMARTGEVAYLREQLQLSARLTARLASTSEIDELAQMVVEELHETFAFYLAAIQRLDEDGVLRLVAGRGPLAEVMAEFLLTEQHISTGVNGKVARSGHTLLIADTRTDPDYIVRDPSTDPRAELAVPVFVDGAVWGVLNIEATDPGALAEADAVLVEAIASSFGEAVHRARLLADLESAFTTALAVLTSTVEAKDDYTACHGEDVAVLAERIARRMSLPGALARDVRYAAMLHDIGKVAVPSEILLKPGPLTDEEWVTMRGHAAIGGDLVARIDAFAHLAPAVRASHERWDGGGYPDGLAGECIPLAARIIAACDTYDAIVTDRPYRPARSSREACAELRRVAGTQLDPDVVGAVVDELNG
ncbi:MAG TPA: HD domain-containing phosphohydrolase [Solirubrobacteraceae bacterium]|nr:HD domain-containing phosphohydrolase [Solirubrobacteraceae bacterium]